jgi:hypothetical protein
MKKGAGALAASLCAGLAFGLSPTFFISLLVPSATGARRAVLKEMQ